MSHLKEVSVKRLLVLTALLEGATGALFLAYPPLMVRVLFGEVVAGAGVVMARLAGICLVAFAVACWPAANSLRGLYGMATYNTVVALYLTVVGLNGIAGVLLWPAVVVHVVLSILLANTWMHHRKTRTKSN